MTQATEAQLDRLLGEARRKERAGDRAGALRLLEAAPPPLRDAGLYQHALGALRARGGDLAGAVVAFERAVALDPGIPEYAGNLGAALLAGAWAQGPDGTREVTDPARLGRAVEVLAAAVQRGPRSPDVACSYGLALLLDGQVEAAAELLEAAAAAAPEHLATIYNSALAQHALGRLDICAARLERCLQLDPGFAPARAGRRRLGR